MSGLIDRLATLEPSPWAFGIVFVVAAAIAIIAVARYHYKNRDRESRRRAESRLEMIRSEREKQHRQDMIEIDRIMVGMMEAMFELEKLRLMRRDDARDDNDQDDKPRETQGS